MIVTDEHFRYLAVQSGAQNSLIGDPAAWRQHYERSLVFDAETIRPYLPRPFRSVLDIGGGLGGIDVMLAKRFPGLAVTIVDGVDDEPEVTSHAKTFSNARVAHDFLTRNGVYDARYHGPDEFPDQQFDLVLSRRSWCFHYAPEVYLAKLKPCLRPGTILILDVRHSRIDWYETLCDRFEFIATAHSEAKFDRQVYRAA